MLSAERPHSRISRNGRTSGSALKCASAWRPVPKIARTFGVGAGKRVGGAGGCASGADFGHGFRVGDAADGAGRSVDTRRPPLVPGAARPPGIGEYADQLGAEGRERGKLARHGAEHVVLADSEDLPKRLRPLAARQRDHRAPHRLDAAGIIEQLLDSAPNCKGDRHGEPLPAIRR